MMKKIYSIRDAKSGVYLAPRFNLTHGEAERDFHMMINNEKSMFFHYPEDYDLYHLGEFDDVSGKTFALETPQHIVKGVNLKTNTSNATA